MIGKNICKGERPLHLESLSACHLQRSQVQLPRLAAHLAGLLTVLDLHGSTGMEGQGNLLYLIHYIPLARITEMSHAVMPHWLLTTALKFMQGAWSGSVISFCQGKSMPDVSGTPAL